MNAIKVIRSLFLWIVVAMILPILYSCGSGGGGGGSEGMSYTGLTTQAIIDINNVIDIVTGAYSGAGVGSLVIVPEKSNLSQSGNGSIIGDCGGSASYTVNIDAVTGDLTATYSFNNYCSLGAYLSGNVDFSGKVNTSSGDIIQLNASFNSLIITSECQSFTSQGSIDLNSTVGTLNFLMRNNNTGKVYKIEDYIITSTAETGYVNIEISGKYYNPDFGYVIVSTDTPFRFYSADLYPSEGVLISSGNNTKAKLTAVSTTQYRIEADTNGDGEYNWSSSKDWGEGCGGGEEDTEPPTVPTGLTATSVSSSQINLSWGPSTDNVGVTGYKLYRGGIYIKSVQATSTSDTGLSSSTTYCYTVSAYDANDNESGQSTQACAVTQSGGGGPGIDLQPTYFYTGSTVIYRGEERQIDYKVKNNGTNASGSYVIKIYLSKDDHNISANDYMLKTITATSLPGGSETPLQSTIVTNPTNLIIHGDYYYIIKVDADNQINETNENNNELFRYGTVKS